MKADKAEGRIIHLSFDVTFFPPEAELGEVDNALAIGRGLIHEAMLLLKAAGEKEGFRVEVEAGQVVY